MNYLDELNEAQRNAVEYIRGPSLVIAGAGSGKTRVLTYKIVYLIKNGYKPENLLALTFTNKAADEMKQRIAGLIGEKETKKLWMGTFHSVFARILRVEAEKINFSNNFTIYDTEDSKKEIADIIKEMNLDPSNYKAQLIAGIISKAKNNLYTPKTYENDPEIQKANLMRKIPEVSRIFIAYQKRLKTANAMDFDDLLLYTNILFRDFPDVLKKYSQIFRFILVDEYQDTNFAQYLIIKKMAYKHRKISVVGDDSQSIYAFRGARIENILNFQKDFPDAQIFKLEQNYRSTQNIINAANSVIEKNENRIPKKIFTKNQTGEKVRITQYEDDKQEANAIAKEIKNLIENDKNKPSDFAILYRINALSRLFEQAMRKYNIPYKIFGSISFYKRQEIKDILAYLRVVVNPHDDQALKRILNIPKRGIGNTTKDKLSKLASENVISIWQVLENIRNFKHLFSIKTVSKLLAFRALIKSFMEVYQTMNAFEFTVKVLTETGLEKFYMPGNLEAETQKYENLKEFLNDVSQYTEENPGAKITEFLQNVSLQTSEDKTDTQNGEFVSLMTVHASKGLEFPYIYIVGTEDGIFPISRALNSTTDLEEERRLFYVAITRAKKHLYISFAVRRMSWGKYNICIESRFLDEIHPQYITKQKNNDFDFYIQNRNFAYEKKIFDSKPDKNKLVQIDKKTRKIEKKDFDPVSGLKVGMRVKHPKFGNGTVTAIEDEGANTKAEVDFLKVGKKKLLLKFAKLTVI